MDEIRKNAYRILLYTAMLDIRGLCPQFSDENNVSPAWQSPVSGAIAYWLHNLAFYAAHDFAGFDEEEFWNSYEGTQHRFPQFSLEHYRQTFEKFVSDSQDRK